MSELHLEYSVARGTARQMARSIAFYRLTRPTFYGAIGLEVLAAILFAAAGSNTWGLVALVAALVSVGLLFLQVPTLARALTARGFQPGTTLAVDWRPDTFTITAPAHSSTHQRAEVRHFAVQGEAALLRLRAARMLIVLPAQLVPPEVRPGLGARVH
jgi:hypothetical protein